MGTAVNGRRVSVPTEERAFLLISGHRALDFLATLRDRHRDPTECLRAPADLDRWLAVVGLPLNVRANPEDLHSARRLRETINRIVRATLASEPPPTRALRELNLWASQTPLAPQADPNLRHHWTAERPVEAGLVLVAREAVELITSPERTLIRECAAAPNCSRLYVDRSRAHRRRWCHMQWCGSQAKMTNYRQRKKATP
ncbi:MAG TPA: CGNR zinc finger domain-containing protein [Mycobacterium sp.]|nr:CGNR zinc finger domain-containing protein [Mycobacterium sp.]